MGWDSAALCDLRWAGLGYLNLAPILALRKDSLPKRFKPSPLQALADVVQPTNHYVKAAKYLESINCANSYVSKVWVENVVSHHDANNEFRHAIRKSVSLSVPVQKDTKTR